jgi:hypothetical protein
MDVNLKNIQITLSGEEALVDLRWYRGASRYNNGCTRYGKYCLRLFLSRSKERNQARIQERRRKLTDKK